MTQEHIAMLLEDALLTLEEMAAGCSASREWVIARVQSGMLAGDFGTDPFDWRFSGADLLRMRQLLRIERDFDADPELAALVTDLLDELRRLRRRMLQAGLSID